MADFFVDRLAADLAADGQELPPAWRVVLGKAHHQLAPEESALYARSIAPRRRELRWRVQRIYEREGAPEDEWRAALEAARVGPALPIVGELVAPLWTAPDGARARRPRWARHPLWDFAQSCGLLLLVLGTVSGFLAGGPAMGAAMLGLLVVFVTLTAVLRGFR